MKEKVMALWGKVVENKAVVIRVGGAVAGALVGVVVAGLVANSQEEGLLEEVVMEDMEEADDESE